MTLAILDARDKEYVVVAAGADLIASYVQQAIAAGQTAQASASEAAASAAAAALAAAEVPALRRQVSAIQRIGPSAILSASSSSGQGTFTFGKPFERSGRGLSVPYYGMGSGTAYIHVASREDSTITIVAERSFTVAPGQQTVEFPDLEFEAGQYVGGRWLSGLIGVETGSSADFGGYWSANTQISEGNTYDDASLSMTGALRIAIDLMSPLPLEQTVETVGEEDPTPTRIGLPDGVTPATGSAVGAQTYVFATPAPYDCMLSEIEGFSLTPGAYALRRYTLISTTMTPVDVPPVSVTVADTGAFTLDEVPDFQMLEGEYLGVTSLGGKYSLVSASGNSTPYWAGPPDGSAFTVGSPTSTLIFNFGLSFLPRSLSTRVKRLEDGGSSSVTYAHATNAFILICGLGESHMSGRSPLFSSNIPEGRGYQYRRATTSIAHLADPTSNEAVTTGSWGPAIGETLLDMTDGAVGAVFINSGHGGDEIADWATAGSSWIQAKADIAAAKAAIKSSKLPIFGAAINIAIGTNDMYAGTAKADFKTGMIDLFGRARTELDAGPNVPIILTQIPPYVDSSYDAAVLVIQEAIAELCREEANVFMGSSATKFATEKGWLNSDKIHLNDAGNQAIGSGVAPVALAHGSGFYPAGLE